MAEQYSGEPEADVIDILTTDHREMIELISRIESTLDASQRRDLADTVIAEIMRHAVAEEMYVYPAIEEHLPDGPEEVRHDKQEHQDIVELMKQIENADASAQQFMVLIRQFEAQLRHHIQDEEADQFPRLRAHIPREKLFDMGQKVATAKRLAPTRPHPSAPHSELFHKTVGPGVGMVDRLLDKLTGRQTG